MLFGFLTPVLRLDEGSKSLGISRVLDLLFLRHSACFWTQTNDIFVSMFFLHELVLFRRLRSFFCNIAMIS